MGKNLKKSKSKSAGSAESTRPANPQNPPEAELAMCRKEIKKIKLSLEIEVARRTKELKTEVEHLRDVSRSKDEYIRTTNHELRTPLDIIRGNLDMVLKGETGEISKQTKEYLGDALMGADRLTKLVNDMLDIFSVEGGRMKFNLGEADIAEILKRIKTEFSSTAKVKEKKLSIYAEIPENLPKVFSDSSRIFQVLDNFLGNSLKFTPAGGSITLRAYPENDTVVVVVEDTGIGIKPKDQAKLFKRFPQIDTSMIQSPRGTGLGLYLVKQIVDKLGGMVDVKSDGLGKGTKFFVRLPRAGTDRAKSVENYYASLNGTQ